MKKRAHLQLFPQLSFLNDFVVQNCEKPRLPSSDRGTAQLVGLARKLFSAKFMTATTEGSTSVSDIKNDIKSLFLELPIV